MPKPLSATDHVLALLRASGPSSLGEIALELFEQCEGVNDSNHKITAFHTVARLVNDGLVTVETLPASRRPTSAPMLPASSMAHRGRPPCKPAPPAS
jgi:hypothetical protein